MALDGVRLGPELTRRLMEVISRSELNSSSVRWIWRSSCQALRQPRSTGRRSQPRIRLRYRQDSGGFNPIEEWQKIHGGEGGRDRRSLELADGVVIRRIEARTGTRVDRLWLTTSGGQRLGGGGDKAELDALRPVIARFAPPPLLGARSRERGSLKGKGDHFRSGLAKSGASLP
ncbi:hypothetical protein NZK32_15720 [Cyanobium sp. FGCU-52]|nr:hypothetical protein [Cyanobium sp. FGCU52]